MIKVISPGFYSTIQDLGRMGYQHFGVPYSGVMDRYSASLSNSLLGNTKNAAVIEMTMTGAKLVFSCSTSICISGADMSPQLNAAKISLNKSIPIKSGDVLSFGKLNTGFRSYLAVSGGFDTDVVMRSRSMYNGITNRYVLAKNDTLPIAEYAVINDKHASVKMNNAHFSSEIIEAYKGPEFDKLSTTQIEELCSTKFDISKDNNRMGYQLEQTLTNNLDAIITSLVMPGTVQLTPSGKLIVLMRDCQTTGGYPRILQLKESAIHVLAQKYTGKRVSFTILDY